ncbi:MAG TPA: XrtA-associated tyrosine autokinase [Casimicrobiaceae bacterium]|jgi:receptor protein-tyrosine kinase
MSSIEQAARRLEELRRAGADIGPAADRDGALPTPEALMRTVQLLEADRAPATAPPHVPPSPREPGEERRIDLGLPKLRSMGFVTPDSGATKIADEFRVIKRPIIRNALGLDGTRIKHGNLVMVTSALPREGKTFTSVNLALSIAMEFNSTVLLVDGDVAHPTLPSLLDVPSAPGLLDLLTGGANVGDALIKTNVERLSLLPAGSRHPRATELLASAQMGALLAELSERYRDRIIVFDSPPLLATTEARVMAMHMGQIVMVVAADQTTQHAVSQALATIESCDVVLMLLNKCSQTEVGSYYGYYAKQPER